MRTHAAIAFLLFAQLSQISLFEGDWKTDVLSSLDLSSNPAVQSGISFAVTAGKVKLTQRFVSPREASKAFDEALLTDGQPHPSTLGPNWTVVATWATPYLLDLMYTGGGDRLVTVHVTYSLSANQKTLTRRGVYSANGYIEERIFYR